MNNQELSALFERYLNGTATVDEIAIITKWYHHYEGEAEQIGTLSKIQQQMLKERMFKNIQTDINEEIHIEEIKIKPIFRRRWLQVAAIFVVCLSVKFFLSYPDSYQANQIATAINDFHLNNNSNHIIKQVLPDQSIVYLDPASSITYPKHFAKNSREVQMQGSCFFEITKNPNRPFIINSDRIVTKVWGTSFKITDRGLTAATVSVLTGKVSVVKKNDNAAKSTLLTANEIILHAMEKVSLSQHTASLAKESKPDLSELSIWKHIDLSFNGENLPQIVKVLNTKFDAEITIGDEQLNHIVMNADLSDLNLVETLSVLKASLNLDYQIADRRVILTRKK